MGWYYCVQDCTDVESVYRHEGKAYNVGYDPVTPYMVPIDGPGPTNTAVLQGAISSQASEIEQLKKMVADATEAATLATNALKAQKEPAEVVKEPKEPKILQDSPKSYSKMNKGELLAVASAHGIGVEEGSTNAEIIELIKSSESKG